MSVEDSITNAMLKLLRERGCDAVRVNSYEEEQQFGGYCDTCYSDWTVVSIVYVTSQGVIDEYEYYGSFAELIRELTQY